MGDLKTLLDLNFLKIRFNGFDYNPNALHPAINHLARFLKQNVKSTSPFILLSAYNHIKTIIAYYAILKAGKIVVILDPACRTLEMAEIIEDIDPAAIIYLNSSSLKFNYQEEIVFRKSSKVFIIKSELKDVCTIMYTNAEDGYSKGAMLSHINLLTEIKAIIETIRLDQCSVSFSLLPFAHLFGFVLGVLIATHSGGSSVITELNMLKLAETIENIALFKATHVYSVPSVYYLMSKHEQARECLKNVKMFISGGTKLPQFIFEGFERRVNHRIFEGYGLTESSPACIFNKLDDGPRVETIGKPIANSEIKIMDDKGAECKLNEVGEIWVKGDLIFKGYFNQEETTNEKLTDGWLHTGDYGKIDGDGFIYYCGLKKSMINVAGNKVFPKKIERLIRVNKNVVDVTAFSEESALQGQILGIKVKLRDNSLKSQDEFKNWCLENITITIIPKWIFS